MLCCALCDSAQSASWIHTLHIHFTTCLYQTFCHWSLCSVSLVCSVQATCTACFSFLGEGSLLFLRFLPFYFSPAERFFFWEGSFPLIEDGGCRTPHRLWSPMRECNLWLWPKYIWLDRRLTKYNSAACLHRIISEQYNQPSQRMTWMSGREIMDCKFVDLGSYNSKLD